MLLFVVGFLMILSISEYCWVTLRSHSYCSSSFSGPMFGSWSNNRRAHSCQRCLSSRRQWSAGGCRSTITFLGAFGHDMLKHTHNCGPACPLWSAVSASAPKRRSKNIRTAWNARLSVCADVVKRRQSIGRSSLVESIRVERI